MVSYLLSLFTGLQILADVTEETINASRVMSDPLDSSVLTTKVYDLSEAAGADLKSSLGASTEGPGFTTEILDQRCEGKSAGKTGSKDVVAVPPTLSSNKEADSCKQASGNVSECKVSPENRKYETLCALLGFGKPQNKLTHGVHGAATIQTKNTESMPKTCQDNEGQLQVEKAMAKHPDVVPSIISKVHSVLEKCRGEKRKCGNVIGADSERKRSLRMKQEALNSKTRPQTGNARKLSDQKSVQKETANKSSHTEESNEAPRRSLRKKSSGSIGENTQRVTKSPKSVQPTSPDKPSTATQKRRSGNKHACISSGGETSTNQESEAQGSPLEVESTSKSSKESFQLQTDACSSETNEVELRSENDEGNRPEKGVRSSEAAVTGGPSGSSAVVSESVDFLEVSVETPAEDGGSGTPSLSVLGRTVACAEESSSQNVDNANVLDVLSKKRLTQTDQIKRQKSCSFQNCKTHKQVPVTNASHYSSPILREIDMFQEDSGVELLQTVETNSKTVLTTQSGQCVICGQDFESSQSFAAHIMYSHFKFKCQKCLAVFSKRDALEDHVRVDSICQGPRLKNRRRKRSDARSESTASKRKDLRCGDCDQVFGHRSRLDRHQLEAHNPVVICSVCNEMFQSFARLRVHIDLVHTQQEHICDVCGKSFKALANMLCHRKRHGAAKRFVCGDCGKAFKDKCAWKDHLETHKPKEERTCRFICPTCGKRFQSKRVCLDHQNTHTGTRPYKCELCHLRFAGLGIVKSHMKMKHSDNRPFRCESCPKAFKEKRALQAHTVTHTGISEHKCLHCGRPFGTATICKTHMRTCKKSKTFSAVPEAPEQTESCETIETLVVDTSAVEVQPEVDENQSAVETMELAFDDQQIAELQVTTEVVDDPLVFMCSACNETFDDMESAATHISLCQVEGKEENTCT